MADDSSLMFKVVIIGDSGVGKSNLMTRYTTDEFNADSPSTIGVEFMTKNDKVNGRDCKVQIWDTAGQERFRAISRSIYHGSKGAMLVYDITNEQSFNSIPNWLSELRIHVHTSCSIFLIGNKCDLEHVRAVKRDTADKFARDNGINFLETSALDKTNVDKAFSFLVRQIYEQSVNAPVEGGGKPGAGVKPRAGQAVNLSAQANNKENKSEKKKCSC